ncbi:MAG: polymer-forming cytoskeletal protein [Hyphomicrobiaceae bacterium]
MQDKNSQALISADTVFEGEVRNCSVFEVAGYVNGTVNADHVIVQPGGRIYGRVNANTAEVLGEVQGDFAIKELFQLRSSGQASGNIRYGRISVEDGAVLSANVRNVPPELAGDFQISVKKGAAAAVTTADITAIDPDDEAKDLVFTVTKPTHGFVALNTSPKTPVTRFSQADLQNGKVLFAHDGTQAPTASFDIVVADASGATSGGATTVKVDVRLND